MHRHGITLAAISVAIAVAACFADVPAVTPTYSLPGS
jgi:hypothetical protein